TCMQACNEPQKHTHTHTHTHREREREREKKRNTFPGVHESCGDLFIGSRMRPNENGYNRRGNRTYAHVHTANSEINLASIFYHCPRVVRVPFYIESGNKSMKCNENYLFCCE